jgi:hypothetical protein
MDEVARGIARAALIPQSALLPTLVAHGAMSPEQALEVVDVAVEVSKRIRALKEEHDVALVTVEILQGVREGLADVVPLGSVTAPATGAFKARPVLAGAIAQSRRSTVLTKVLAIPPMDEASNLSEKLE